MLQCYNKTNMYSIMLCITFLFCGMSCNRTLSDNSQLPIASSIKAENGPKPIAAAEVDVRIVYVRATNEWTLNIHPNGGAEFFIIGGSVADEMGQDPAGTFNFNEVLARASIAQRGNTGISVGFSADASHPGGIEDERLSDADADYFFGLYKSAYKAANPDPQSGVARLWRKYPPGTQEVRDIPFER